MSRSYYYYNRLFLRKLLQNVKFLRKQAKLLSFKSFIISFLDVVTNIISELDGDSVE